MSHADELQAGADAFADLSLKFIEGLPSTDRARRLAGQYPELVHVNCRELSRLTPRALAEPLLAEAEELARIFGASDRTAKRRHGRGADRQ